MTRLLIEELQEFDESLRRLPGDVLDAARRALPLLRITRARGVIWVAVWRSRAAAEDANARAKLIIRLGRPDRLLFTERNQGAHGIPVRWHYAFGGRLAARWEPRLPG